MARKDNSSGFQFNFFEDHYERSYPAIKQAVVDSWAGPFGDHLFPLIDESIFDPLYSTVGRPSAPINVLYGACLLQLLLDISDDELFLRILTDLAFQYALHTTTNETLPFSRGTFKRFKTKLIMHYIATDDDLFNVCCKDIARQLKAQKVTLPRLLKHIDRFTADDLRPASQKKNPETK